MMRKEVRRSRGRGARGWWKSRKENKEEKKNNPTEPPYKLLLLLRLGVCVIVFAWRWCVCRGEQTCGEEMKNAGWTRVNINNGHGRGLINVYRRKRGS